MAFRRKLRVGPAGVQQAERARARTGRRSRTTAPYKGPGSETACMFDRGSLRSNVSRAALRSPPERANGPSLASSEWVMGGTERVREGGGGSWVRACWQRVAPHETCLRLTAVATEAGGGCSRLYASCNIAQVWHTRDQPQALQQTHMCGHVWDQNDGKRPITREQANWRTASSREDCCPLASSSRKVC